MPFFMESCIRVAGTALSGRPALAPDRHGSASVRDSGRLGAWIGGDPEIPDSDERGCVERIVGRRGNAGQFGQRREERVATAPRTARQLRRGDFKADDADREMAGFFAQLDSRREDQELRTLRSAHMRKASQDVDRNTFTGTAEAMLHGWALETDPVLEYVWRSKNRKLLNKEQLQELE